MTNHRSKQEFLDGKVDHKILKDGRIVSVLIFRCWCLVRRKSGSKLYFNHSNLQLQSQYCQLIHPHDRVLEVQLFQWQASVVLNLQLWQLDCLMPLTPKLSSLASSHLPLQLGTSLDPPSQEFFMKLLDFHTIASLSSVFCCW